MLSTSPPDTAKSGSFNVSYNGVSAQLQSAPSSPTPSHRLVNRHLAGPSPSSTALLIAQSFMQRSTGRGSHQPRHQHTAVAPYPTSSIQFNQATASSTNTTASSHHNPHSNSRLANKRKVREALMAESFSPSSRSTVNCSPHQHLDALLMPPSASSSSSSPSKLSSVLLIPNEPVPDYGIELEAPVFSEYGDLGARNSEGELFRWPWLQEHQGQIWSPPSKRAPHPLDVLINLGLDKASADGNRGRLHSGVRAWFAFMVDDMHSTPHRPMDPQSPLWAKLNEEWLFMKFACALIRDRGVTIGTVRSYCSAVQGWHAREHGVKLAAGLKLERLLRCSKGSVVSSAIQRSSHAGASHHMHRELSMREKAKRETESAKHERGLSMRERAKRKRELSM